MEGVASKTSAEQRAVAVLIGVFIGVALVLVGIPATRLAASSSASRTMAQTFQAVNQRQGDFRLMNARFASWPELEAKGASLPEGYRVLRSNASASHWFLSLQHAGTGVVCERVGELLDHERDPRTLQPACRKVAAP